MKRKNISKILREKVFEKTNGRCHVCGKRLVLNAKEGSRGRWHVDHILQVKNAGSHEIGNYLPICRDCNFLRRGYKSKKMRRIFRFGIVAHDLSKKDNEIGKKLKKIYNKRRKSNFAKRKVVK